MKRYIAVVIVLSMLFISGCTNNRTETAQIAEKSGTDRTAGAAKISGVLYYIPEVK